ncbi:hypothetical protein AAMO2058_000269200 [Amorphochlora amoebiformis]
MRRCSASIVVNLFLLVLILPSTSCKEERRFPSLGIFDPFRTTEHQEQTDIDQAAWERRRVRRQRKKQLKAMKKWAAATAKVAGVSVAVSTAISACSRSRFLKRKVFPRARQLISFLVVEPVLTCGGLVLDTLGRVFPFMRTKKKKKRYNPYNRWKDPGDSESDTRRPGEESHLAQPKSFWHAVWQHVKQKAGDTYDQVKSGSTAAWHFVAEQMSNDAFFTRLAAEPSAVVALSPCPTSSISIRRYLCSSTTCYEEDIRDIPPAWHGQAPSLICLLRRALMHYHPDKNR